MKRWIALTYTRQTSVNYEELELYRKSYMLVKIVLPWKTWKINDLRSNESKHQHFRHDSHVSLLRKITYILNLYVDGDIEE